MSTAHPLLRVCLLLLAALVLIVPAGCDNDPEKVAIREVWNGWGDLLARRDANGVIAMFTADGIRYYDRIVKVAREGSRAEILRLSPLEQLEVLRVRHNCAAKDLEGLDGRGLIRTAIERGWWNYDDDDDWEPFKLGSIKINGEFAWGDLIVEGKKTHYKIEFIKENDSGQPDPAGRWRLAHQTLDPYMDHWLTRRATTLGRPMEGYLKDFLAFESGRRPRNDIFDRPTVR